jgi:hypothetical protein
MKNDVDTFMEACLDAVLSRYKTDEIRRGNGKKLRETYRYTEASSPVKRKKGHFNTKYAHQCMRMKKKKGE